MILIGTLVLEMEYAMLEITGEFQHVLRFVKALMVANISLCQRQFHASLVSFTKVAIVQSLPTMTTKYTKCKKVMKAFIYEHRLFTIVVKHVIFI